MAFHHFQFSKIPVIYISLFFISNAHKKLSYVYCGIENWWHFYPFQWNIDYRQRQGKRVTSLTTICRIVFLRSLSIKPWLRGCLYVRKHLYIKKRLRRADRDFELVRRWKMSLLVDVSLFLPMCVCVLLETLLEANTRLVQESEEESLSCDAAAGLYF